MWKLELTDILKMLLYIILSYYTVCELSVLDEYKKCDVSYSDKFT